MTPVAIPISREIDPWNEASYFFRVYRIAIIFSSPPPEA